MYTEYNERMNFFGKKKFFDKSNFLDLNKSQKPCTVMVQMMNGKVKEYPGIQKPWQYIAKVKKNPDVKNAWIKNNK